MDSVRCGECRYKDDFNYCYIMGCHVDPQEYMCGEGEIDTGYEEVI